MTPAGPSTWQKLYDVFHSIQGAVTPPEEPGIPYPGTPLRLGSRGENVRRIQSNLQAISKVLPVVPTLAADGIFGVGTQNSVIAFQRFFGLTADGVVGPASWDKITSVYANLPDVSSPQYPGTALRVGSRGNDVLIMQKYLNSLSARYPSIPSITADGIFGAATERAVIALQRLFGLVADGVIGQTTWNFIVSLYNLNLIGNLSIEAVAHGSPTGAARSIADIRGQYMWMMMLRMLRR